MNPEFPKRIIVKDIDGGYTICELKEVITDDGIPLYETVEYYHDLASALRELR